MSTMTVAPADTPDDGLRTVVAHSPRTAETILRVGAASPAQSLASAISHALYDNRRVTLRAIGAGSVNQAMKGCAIARGYVAQRGLDLVVRPGFTEVEGTRGDELSAMVFVVKVE